MDVEFSTRMEYTVLRPEKEGMDMIERFQNFLTGITVCYKYVQRIKNAEMTEFGLKGTHVACIFYLKHNPEGLTSSQLCSLCAEDKASISRTVAYLRRRGYIESNGTKAYRAPLHLTEAGMEVAQQMEPAIEEWVGIGGIGLTDEQRELFYDTLALIADNLRTELEK